MNEILFQIYFSINLFIAGYIFNTDIKEARFGAIDTFQEKLFIGIILFFCTLFNIVLGVFITILPILWEILLGILKQIIFIFQLDFWWSWFFTKKWESAEIDTLRRINQIAKRKKRNTIHGRIYLYGLGLINKKNNYTYTDESQSN